MNKLKKIFVMLAVCVLFTSCGSENNQTTDTPRDNSQVEKPVAVIENYEEVAENISIKRANGTPTGAEALLYPNDEITGNIDKIKIKCAPYAESQIKNGAYVISYDPPSGISGVAYDVVDYASSFWDNVETVTAGVSRGSDDDLNLNPKPGFNVTLLQNQPVIFAWDDSSKKFIITDETGKEIFSKNVAGKNSVEIIPSELNLTAGQKYLWGLDENLKAYKFTILDAQIEKEISTKLDEIDAENISAEEKILNKAAYVQLVSDIYPDTIDLYWLSAQWLLKISPNDENLKTTKNILLRKCARHLDEEM